MGVLTVPYVVSFDGNVIMMGFTDRQESVTLEAGVHTISRTFQHTEKGWSHELRARAANKSFVTLDAKSEAEKDKPSALGSAFVVVNAAN